MFDKEPRNVAPNQIRFDETTKCLATHAFAHAMGETMEAHEKGIINAEDRTGCATSHMIAACAGPLAMLGAMLSLASMQHAQQNPDADSQESLIRGITPDLMLYASLLVRRSLQMKSNQNGSFAYDFEHSPGSFAGAMRDFNHMTGRDIHNALRPDVVAAAAKWEALGKSESQEMLRRLRGGENLN